MAVGKLSTNITQWRKGVAGLRRLHPAETRGTDPQGPAKSIGVHSFLVRMGVTQALGRYISLPHACVCCRWRQGDYDAWSAVSYPVSKHAYAVYDAHAFHSMMTICFLHVASLPAYQMR